MRIKDARQTFVGIWIRKLLEGEAIEVWGGNQLRDFNYIDDCVDALLNAICSDKANGKVFNLGSNEVISLKDLAKMLIEINGTGDFVINEYPDDRKKIDIGDYYSNYKLIKETLCWEPRVPLRNGLKKTLDFYKNNFKNYI